MIFYEVSTSFADFLIILCVHFKIALRMITYRAYRRCFCSYHNMSTVTAFPNLDLALFKHLRSFNIFKKCTISLLVMLLNLSYSSEFCCKFRKTFFLSCFSKTFIHICPLIIFAFSSSCQIFLCITDSS